MVGLVLDGLAAPVALDEFCGQEVGYLSFAVDQPVDRVLKGEDEVVVGDEEEEGVGYCEDDPEDGVVDVGDRGCDEDGVEGEDEDEEEEGEYLFYGERLGVGVGFAINLCFEFAGRVG